MKIELTDKEFEMLKILISNTNECESGCYIEEYQEQDFDCRDCDFYKKKWNLIDKIKHHSEYKYVWNRNTIDLEKFTSGEIAVYCDTEEKVNDFFNVLKGNEILWETGKPLGDETYSSIYKDRTAYNFENIGILYASVGYYKALNYKVIKWEVE